MYDDILLFVKLINRGTFSALASKIGVSQSTISRKIVALEKELGLKLIKENSRLIETTEAGEIIYNNFKGFEQSIIGLIAPIYESNKKARGVIRVMLPVFLSHYAISAYLPTFIRDHPELDIRITYNSYNVNMRKENYDIVVVAFLPPQLTQKVKLLHTDKIILVASREYVESNGLPTSITELENHLLVGKILFNQSIINYVDLYSESDESAIRITNPEHLRTNSFLEILYLIKHGSVIAGLPEASILSELTSGELVRVLPNYHCGYVKHYILKNIDDSDLRYKEFEQFLYECLKRLNYSRINNTYNNMFSQVPPQN